MLHLLPNSGGFSLKLRRSCSIVALEQLPLLYWGIGAAAAVIERRRPAWQPVAQPQLQSRRSSGPGTAATSGVAAAQAQQPFRRSSSLRRGSRQGAAEAQRQQQLWRSSSLTRGSVAQAW